MELRNAFRLVPPIVSALALVLILGPGCGSSASPVLAYSSQSAQTGASSQSSGSQNSSSGDPSDSSDSDDVSMYNVTSYGAVGDGTTDDTKAIAAATQACIQGKGILYFPQGTYLASTVNWSGISSGGCKILGSGNGDADGALGSPVSVIQIRTKNTATGVGIDLSGSANMHIKNIGLQGGTSAANAPAVLVLMGKTSSPNSDANQFFFDSVTMKTYGRYDVYDYGSEAINFNNCEFFGESFMRTDLMTLSAVNSAGITSPNVTLRKPPQSMTAVNFTGQTTFETAGGKNDNQIQNAVVFDAGNAKVAGGVLDATFVGTTFLLYGPHDVALTDPPTDTGQISQVSLLNIRAEGDGGMENQLINLHTHAMSLGWTITGQWASVGQTVPEMEFIGQLGSSYVNWNSQASGECPTAPTIEAASGNGTIAVIENGSENPVVGANFNYTANGNPTYNFQSIATGVLDDATSGKPALYLNSGIATWKEGVVDSLVKVPSSANPVFQATAGNVFQVRLSTDVNASTLTDCSSGTRLTIDIIEDSSGGHTWSWPTNVHGGGEINGSPYEHNVQSFYCDGINVWATGPMVSAR